MFTLQAPLPVFQTTTFLPNPLLSDSEEVMASVTRKLAIDGTRYTYVKRKDRRKLRWIFRLTRNKALELRAFITSYFASKIQFTDHNNRVWGATLSTTLLSSTRTETPGPAIAPMPLGERVHIELEFEGVEQ